MNTTTLLNESHQFKFRVLAAGLVLLGMAPLASLTAQAADASGGDCDASLRRTLTTGSGTILGTGASEIIVGSPGDDVIWAGGGDDIVCGMGGDDVIYGEEGNDAIYGGNGNDVIYGQDGWDFIFGGAGPDKLDGGDDVDRIFGGAGADTLYGGNGDDELALGPGNVADRVHGGMGSDWIDFRAATARVVVNLDTGRAIGHGIDTLLSIENAWGSERADVITGDDRANRLFGGRGDDTINGRGGDDLLLGNNGDNTINGGGGDDTLYGNAAYWGFFEDPPSPSSRLDGGAGSDGCDGEAETNCELDMAITFLG